MAKKKLEELRSQRWFGATDLRSFGHRSRMLQMGYERDDFMGKPVVGIINTWSDISPCHTHFRDARRGHQARHLAGGRLPGRAAGAVARRRTSSSRRPCSTATSWPWRPRSCCARIPVDGAVLMGGCDKTTPGTIMGGISMNLPMIFMPAGPMMRGHFGGNILGSGSDVWKYWAEKEAGNITSQQWNDMEAGIARSAGTCMTMGTASTMTSIAEALGLTLPGASSIPAGDAAHPRMASACGRRIVEMVWEDLKPSDIIDRALGRERARGAQRAGGLDQRHDPSRRHGAARRRADHAEGLRRFRPAGAGDRQSAPLGRVADGGLLHRRRHARRCSSGWSRSCTSMRARCAGTMGDGLEDAEVYNDDVIRPLDKPIAASGGTAILYGNLAPDGCVIKPPAADPRLLQHTGPALVFDNYDEMSAAVNDLDLDVTPDHVMVLRNAGPDRRAGHARMGHAADPEEAAEAGRARHAAHLRCAHERHQLRRLHPACRRRKRRSAARWRRCAPAT